MNCLLNGDHFIIWLAWGIECANVICQFLPIFHPSTTCALQKWLWSSVWNWKMIYFLFARVWRKTIQFTKSRLFAFELNCFVPCCSVLYAGHLIPRIIILCSENMHIIFPMTRSFCLFPDKMENGVWSHTFCHFFRGAYTASLTYISGNFVRLGTSYNIPKNYSFGIHGNQVQGRISVNLNIPSKIAAIAPSFQSKTQICGYRLERHIKNLMWQLRCCHLLRQSNIIRIRGVKKKKGHGGP